MNNLIMWEAIKWYSNNGYESFCFGRTEIKDNTDNMDFMLHIVFSKMPIPISRILGVFLYKHFG